MNPEIRKEAPEMVTEQHGWNWALHTAQNVGAKNENKRIIELLTQASIIRRDKHGVLVANTNGVATDLEGLELE